MSLQFFTIPVHQGAEAEAELNALLARHRIVAVDRQFVNQGSQSFWAICVDYIPGSQGKPTSAPLRERIDYKEKLTAEQFRIFAQLRELRKEIAQSESVPVYAIFTNEQLAKMVVDRVSNKSELGKIEGIGEARVEKYSVPFLKRLSELMGGAVEA